MTAPYDLIAIGTGTAATVAATRCRDAGWRVAIIDHRPFGGTCALRGCDPKKVLVAAAQTMDGVIRMRDVQVIQGTAAIDWAALQRFKRSFTVPVPDKREAMYLDKGIDTFHGQARFLGPTTLQVGDTTLGARHILIATGAEPAPLPIEGADLLAHSDTFLDLMKLPRRIALVGGGFIGFEFAHVAARAGAEVTVLNRGARPLKPFEPDLVDILVQRSKDLGIDVRCGHEVRSIVRSDDALSVMADTSDGAVRFEADLIVHGGGRVPAVADLDLDAGQIDHEDRLIHRNARLQSRSNPAVYIAGDAASPPLPLTPVAALEATAVADALLSGESHPVNYHGIASAVFTVPALGRVGLLESEAKEQGLDYRVKMASVPDWYSARRVNEPSYAYKVLVERDTDRVLGAHVIGPDAVEIINLFAMAMRTGLSATQVADATFAYPTGASDIAYMLP